jgi:hypothetical protein
MRPLLVWHVTQRSYRRFGITYRSNRQGSNTPRIMQSLFEHYADSLSRSVGSYQFALLDFSRLFSLPHHQIRTHYLFPSHWNTRRQLGFKFHLRVTQVTASLNVPWKSCIWAKLSAMILAHAVLPFAARGLSGNTDEETDWLRKWERLKH